MSKIKKLKSKLATFSFISEARKLRSQLLNRIQQMGLSSYGPFPANYWITRYYFYNHTKSGSDAINFLSRFADPGIRKHLQQPLPIRNQAIQDIFKDLKNTGISQFHINTLANGSTILQNIYREIEDRQTLERERISKWQASYTYRLENGTNSKRSFRYDFKPEPNIELPCWKLAIHPDILAVINAYLSAYCRIYFAEYWLSIPLPCEVGPLPAQQWHRDGYGTVVKLFLYLNDVNIENGAFCYASGTDKGLGRMTHGSNHRLLDDEMVSLFGNKDVNIITTNAKAGDIVLANTSAYHKGGFVRNGSRLLFTASYFCPWVQELDAHKSLIPIPARDLIQDLHPAQIFALGL